MESLAIKLENIEKQLNLKRSMVIRDKSGNLKMILIHKPNYVT